MYMIPSRISRESRGKVIADDGGVQRINSEKYDVRSQYGNGVYLVTLSSKGWSCTCPDYRTRQVKCKHIHTVEFSLRLRNEVRESIAVSPVSVDSCPNCNIREIEKFGVRRNKNTAIQRFRCITCKRTFSLNLGFERMRNDPKAITTAM